MRPVIAILLIGAALAVTGCGGPTKPAAGSTVPATPTAPQLPAVSTGSSVAPPSATPTAPQTGPKLTGHGAQPGETPPVRSAASLDHNADGAIAFAAYFYQALDWSIATTDPYLLRQISAPTCGACATYIKEISTVEAAGGYSEGGRVTASAMRLVKGDSRIAAEYTVQVALVQQTQVLVASSGAPSATYMNDAQPTTNFLHLEWGGTGWQAREIGTP